jgi:hypothetical protein
LKAFEQGEPLARREKQNIERGSHPRPSILHAGGPGNGVPLDQQTSRLGQILSSFSHTDSLCSEFRAARQSLMWPLGARKQGQFMILTNPL